MKAVSASRERRGGVAASLVASIANLVCNWVVARSAGVKVIRLLLNTWHYLVSVTIAIAV